MTETQPNAEIDEAGDDAAAAYVARKLAEHREYLEMARRAAAEAQLASDRVRVLARWGRNAER